MHCSIRTGLLGVTMGGIMAVTAPMAVRAADLPVLKAPPAPVMAPRWSGFYVGGHVGGAIGHSELSGYTGFLFPTIVVPGLGAIFSLPATLPGSDSSDSAFIGGIQIGHNWQMGSYVFGLEADIAGTGLSTTASATATQLAIESVTLGATTDIDWVATLRGRIGFAADRWLLYVTGGLAVTRVDATGFASVTVSPPILVPAVGTYTSTTSGSHTRTGWTVGVGGEWALDQVWSFGVEYRHTDFGSVTVSTAIPDGLGGVFATATQDVDVTVDQVTARANYRFLPR